MKQYRNEILGITNLDNYLHMISAKQAGVLNNYRLITSQPVAMVSHFEMTLQESVGMVALSGFVARPINSGELQKYLNRMMEWVDECVLAMKGVSIISPFGTPLNQRWPLQDVFWLCYTRGTVHFHISDDTRFQEFIREVWEA